MPRRSKWTEDEWNRLAEQVKQLYATDGTTHRSIAYRLNCSESTVRNILYGVKPTYFKIDKTKRYSHGRRGND